MNGSLDPARKMELLLAAAVSVAMVGLIVVVQILSQSDSDTSTVDIDLPPIVVFPDFGSIQNVDIKKQQFFDYLQDYVVGENEVIAAVRAQLTAYADIANSGIAFSGRERDWVLELAENFRIESGQSSDQDIVNELMLRVDVIPVSLVLAQAANESAWGTSRFTLEGNNVFGQWCYEEGCGIVPARRRDGDNHEVKSFESVENSVKAYFTNINSHPSYGYLRELRAQMRDRGQQLNPMILALGLGRYSERGDHYIDEVQNIIIQNELRLRDSG